MRHVHGRAHCLPADQEQQWLQAVPHRWQALFLLRWWHVLWESWLARNAVDVLIHDHILDYEVWSDISEEQRGIESFDNVPCAARLLLYVCWGWSMFKPCTRHGADYTHDRNESFFYIQRRQRQWYLGLHGSSHNWGYSSCFILWILLKDDTEALVIIFLPTFLIVK